MSKSCKAFPLIILTGLLLLTACGPKDTPAVETPKFKLPHIRYFESSSTGPVASTFTLFDYDLESLSRQQLWSFTGENINRVDITPDGNYVLVHYALVDELFQYYEIYSLQSPLPDEPMLFYRDNESTTKISAYEAFLDFAVYRNGFIAGDPDFKSMYAGSKEEPVRYIWVNLAAGVIEDIPLRTTMDKVPHILFVPQGGGTIDFMEKGSNQIFRLEWFTAENTLMLELYNKEYDPYRKLAYLGSFSHFADFEPPNPSSAASGKMKVGLRTADTYIPLDEGQFPTWSLWDKYILMRVFPADVMARIFSGADPMETLGYMMSTGVNPKFAIWDVEAGEQREISLELVDLMALPKPIFDPLSDTIAIAEVPPLQVLEDGNSRGTTSRIVVFDIPGDRTITVISGIPTLDQDTGMAFHRPVE